MAILCSRSPKEKPKMFHKALRVSGLVVTVALCCSTKPVNAQSLSAQPVAVRVLVPFADAQLMVDDTLTRQTGTDRIFVSPPLDSGKSYVYTIKTTWQPNNYTTITRTRKITFK